MNLPAPINADGLAEEIKACIGDVAAQLGVKISPRDPVILMVAMNHAMNQRVMARLVEAVKRGEHEVVAGWRVAADDARLLARSTVPEATGEGARIIAQAYEAAAAKLREDTQLAVKNYNKAIEAKWVEMTRVSEASAKRMQMMEAAAVANVYKTARLMPVALAICFLVLLMNIYLVVHRGF